MVSETWYAGIEATVFTQVEYMLKQKYPSLICKTSSETITPAKFPTLYLHETQEEVGQDLYNADVNAVKSTVYIRVWTNTTEKECKDILTAATQEMKRFRYNVKNLPTTKITDKIAFGEIMATRIVGGGDGDIVK